MKTLMLFLCAILSVTISSCGSKSSSSNSSNNTLTQDEINKINTTLMAAVNGAGASSTGSAPGLTNLMPSIEIKNATYASTCNSSNYQFTAAVNNTYSCPTAGHITYTGNLKTYCTSWTYYSSPAVYCICNGNWDTVNSLTFQFGDRTNNLYDCENSGLILDGTVYVNATGVGSAINLSITGSLSANRRGASGGLVPLNSCYINMMYTSSTSKWSGTLCGSSVY